MRKRSTQRQQGQSLTEFIVAISGFGILLLSLLQIILFYRAKATVDYAAMEAARAGALHGADMTAMRKGFARGLTPLYATATASPTAIATAEAFAHAYTDINVFRVGSVTVISPTGAAYDDFKEAQYDGSMALPNDSLNFRSSITGSRSGLSVQDANILKIEVSYDYPMIVPLMDKFLAGFNVAKLDLARTAKDGHTVYSIPIVSSAMVRMQSPVTARGNLAAR